MSTLVLTPDKVPDLGPNGVLLLPTHPRRFGPVTRKLLTRIVVAVAVLVIAGTVR